MAPPTSIVWTTSRSGVVVPSRTVVARTSAEASTRGVSCVTGVATVSAPILSCVKSRPGVRPRERHREDVRRAGRRRHDVARRPVDRLERGGERGGVDRPGERRLAVVRVAQRERAAVRRRHRPDARPRDLPVVDARMRADEADGEGVRRRRRRLGDVDVGEAVGGLELAGQRHGVVVQVVELDRARELRARQQERRRAARRLDDDRLLLADDERRGAGDRRAGDGRVRVAGLGGVVDGDRVGAGAGVDREQAAELEDAPLVVDVDRVVAVARRDRRVPDGGDDVDRVLAGAGRDEGVAVARARERQVVVAAAESGRPASRCSSS